MQLDIGYGSIGNDHQRRQLSADRRSGRAQFRGFLIEQAFGEIALPGNLTLDFGKFATTAGAEVIEANKNWLYSRSLLFNAIPLLHTGVRANLKINDMLTLQGSVVNGWNNDPDLNAWKTIGLSASITASPAVSASSRRPTSARRPPQPARAPRRATCASCSTLVGAFTVNRASAST